MKIHFLDPGPEKYGDSIIIEHAERRIFIDGAHSGNFRQQGDTPSLPDQIASLFGEGVFEPDLLVITHLHGDHVGCLPQMVRDGLVKPKKVLAADEKWGAGIGDETDADPLAGVDPDTRLIAEAMQEEGAEFEDEDEARAFMDAFVSVEAQYREMLRSFDPGTVLRFGRDDLSGIEEEFSNFGLKFLGPTPKHLDACAVFIGREKAKAAANARDAGTGDAPRDLGARLWVAAQARQRENEDSGLADMQGTGSGRNNQSIILAVGKGSKKVLLAGDMQFAKVEVPGLRDTMATLLTNVAAHGPYRIVKLTHHTALNGIDAAQLDELGGNPVLVHTGGLNDPGHPQKRILEMLSRRLEAEKFVRTDRNGIITINLTGAQPQTTFQRGGWNNFDVNPKPQKRAGPLRPPDEIAPENERNPPGQPETGGFVEVTARIPHTSTRVTITVDVQPTVVADAPVLKKKEPELIAKPEGEVRRDLSRILVLTNRERLEQRIGAQATARVLRELVDSGAELLDDLPLSPQPDAAMERSRERLRAGQFRGVLILGGYDVVPSVRFSVVDDATRTAIQSDLDDYIVWSDDGYVSLDDDGFPDLPISRIPDAGDAALVLACLHSRPSKMQGVAAFGLRNRLRPFADRVFAQLATAGCRQSSPTTPDVIDAEELRKAHIYFMLHGHFIDGDQYTGELEPQVYTLAMDRSRIPRSVEGVVFAGCCYGALLTRFPAADTRPDRSPAPRAIEESLALSFLRAGAWAFVGCTAVHYSPPEDSPHTNGEPMHHAFWKHLLAGHPPAEALFEAKRDYLAGMPHGGDESDAYARAVESKILFGFTCLGTGW